MSDREEVEQLRMQLAMALNANIIAQNTSELKAREYALHAMITDSKLARVEAELHSLRNDVNELIDILKQCEWQRVSLPTPPMEPRVKYPTESSFHAELVWLRASMVNAQQGLTGFLAGVDCAYTGCKEKHSVPELVMVEWPEKNADGWPARVERIDDVQSPIPEAILLEHPAFDMRLKTKNHRISRVYVRFEGRPLAVELVGARALPDVNVIWSKLSSYLLVRWNIKGSCRYPWPDYSWVAQDKIRGVFECYEATYGSACIRFGLSKRSADAAMDAPLACSRDCVSGSCRRRGRVAADLITDCRCAHDYLLQATHGL
ncbi:hypothetical protein FVE85_4586 [Porphyridium purpureum]|uniref:Uncharacterized protein n=1 Tax=Porphyridium purpureum TaxID=35688 RepID=A0A5J4YFY4_PORPP|nr:hypothetical protein FVE85_4586 [Porphyridium purpureum]|eukprot:POR1627..scf252_32